MLSEDQPAARPQQPLDLAERLAEVRDVMKRQDGDDGIEWLRVRELLERDGLEDGAVRSAWIDRTDAVAELGDPACELALAATHLENPGGPARKVRHDEGLIVQGDLGGCGRAAGDRDAAARAERLDERPLRRRRVAAVRPQQVDRALHGLGALELELHELAAPELVRDHEPGDEADAEAGLRPSA